MFNWLIRPRVTRGWHGDCIGGGMEALIALIVLAAGLMLERSRPAAEPIRIRTRRD